MTDKGGKGRASVDFIRGMADRAVILRAEEGVKRMKRMAIRQQKL